MERRRKFVLWVIAIVLMCALSGCVLIVVHADWAGKLWSRVPKPQPIPAGQYRITEVYDGDTFAVDMQGNTEKVRLIGVDTPETHKPNTPVQCYGPNASNYTKDIATGKNVRLEADPTNSNRDRYDRLLRYAYIGDFFLNKQLITNGYGFAYTPFEFQKKDEFVEAESIAQTAGKGLWSACTVRIENGVMQTNDL